MTTPILIFLTLVTAPGTATARQTVEERQAATSDGTVKIMSAEGSVRVRGWNRDTVAVTSRLTATAQRVEFTVDGHATRIRLVPAQPVATSGSGPAIGRANAELEIRVPRNSYVAVRTVGATIDVADVVGGADLDSETGDIHVSGGGVRSVYAESAGGDITVEAFTKALRAKSVDGTIIVRDAHGFAEISTVSGPIQLSGEEFWQGEVSSVTGDIQFTGDFDRGAFAFSFETHSGSIELSLPSNVAADFEVRVVKGRIENEFDTASPLAFTTGSGGPQVTITSFKGTVTIRKR